MLCSRLGRFQQRSAKAVQRSVSHRGLATFVPVKSLRAWRPAASSSSSAAAGLSTIASQAPGGSPADMAARGTPRYGVGPAETHNSQIPTELVLRVKCQCGACGFEARGPSAINFTCHCSVCRKASGLPALPAAAFKPENVVWLNEAGMRKDLPGGSRNTRFYCGSCQTYIGEDATRPLGVMALPLHRVAGLVHDSYKPNHHIFYADRVADVHDSAPKWVTLPEGKLVAPKAPITSTVPAADGQRIPTIAGGSNWDAKQGWYRKDVQPLSPTRGPESKVYHFTESDPAPNHVSLITPEKVAERTARKYLPSPGAYVAPTKTKRDVIIIGGGHNGLVAAAYLAAKGLDVLVLERRHTVGGAAVTEELYPGFKFSRASYLAGLLRTHIIKDLNLAKYGFKYLPRDPSSFTPTRLNSPWNGKYLMLGDDAAKNHASISQFSAKDADAFPRYEHFLGQVREMIGPILDGPPPDLSGNSAEQLRTLKQVAALGKAAWRNRDALVPFYELFTAPASHILDRWFESDILKTTLATDAVIGASCSPKHLGSAYVLLHHVMGEAAGKKGVWSYVQGGMGAISSSIAEAARERGAEIVTNATVQSILYSQAYGNGPAKVTGVRMNDGTELQADTVLSNATPYHTFLELLPGLARDSGYVKETSPLPRDFARHIRYADYSCGALKINCAVDRLPNFACLPNGGDGATPGPQHRGTVHFETRMEEIENAQREAAMGIPATRPVVEMTIPSSLDRTIAPPGKHVVQFFVQFAPYDLDPKAGNWADPHFVNAFADRVFRIVEEHVPNFSSSVLYRDVLTPLDLERIFGMHRGNIMHGALALHQLAYSRPAPGHHRHRTPVTGLYLCGAGAHPGGGVMGAPGHNAAHVVLSDLKRG